MAEAPNEYEAVRLVLPRTREGELIIRVISLEQQMLVPKQDKELAEAKENWG